MTNHADLRLIQRTGSIEPSLTEVWDNAVPCEVAYRAYDEARVSPQYELVLLKSDGQIVTCIPETYNVTIKGKNFEEYLESSLDG